jgi:predicted amidohydrolase YtcJ
VFLLVAALTAAAASADPGVVLEGASVYASAEAKPQTLSILVRNGRIALVGDAAKVRAEAPGAKVIDLRGTFLFPGWADAHGHLAGLGKSLETANLRDARNPVDAARRMAQIAAHLPTGVWAEGFGWDQNRWPLQRFPDARDLDQAVADRPAAARRVDGHALWLNSAALKAAGIDAHTQDPPGGRIEHRPDGTPSGVLVDNAMELAERAMPAAKPADFRRQVLAATRVCARAGLTEVQDASAYEPWQISELAGLADRGELPIRIYATVASDPKILPEFLDRGTSVGRGFLTVRAIKTWADGALGSRGAALLADYSDDPGNRGLLRTPAERLNELARIAREKGWQLWIHAIGDRGNRLALDAFAAAEKAVPKAAPGGDRPRIEHAQIVAPDDIARFAREHVIASIQPTHATSDMPWAQARLGPQRIAGAYAWQALKKSGARLAGGSDFPVESENPLLGFYAAVTRQDLAGKPPGGWRPQECLTRPEALALFTSDAAYAAFEEHERGRIETGLNADFTVLEDDPMTVPLGQIPRIRVVLAMVGGRVSFDLRHPEGRVSP